MFGKHNQVYEGIAIQGELLVHIAGAVRLQTKGLALHECRHTIATAIMLFTPMDDSAVQHDHVQQEACIG